MTLNNTTYRYGLTNPFSLWNTVPERPGADTGEDYIHHTALRGGSALRPGGTAPRPATGRQPGTASRGGRRSAPTQPPHHTATGLKLGVGTPEPAADTPSPYNFTHTPLLHHQKRRTGKKINLKNNNNNTLKRGSRTPSPPPPHRLPQRGRRRRRRRKDVERGWQRRRAGRELRQAAVEAAEAVGAARARWVSRARVRVHPARPARWLWARRA